MAPTVTVNPVSTYFGAPPELYPMREQTTRDFIVRTNRSTVRGNMPRTPYPGLQAPIVDPNKALDTLPMGLNRPRKLSTGSINTSMSRDSFQSRISYESRARSSSWSSQASQMSQTSYNSTEPSPSPSPTPSPSHTHSSSPRRQSHYVFQRPAPIKAWRMKKPPGEIFASLPGAVLEVILAQLKKLHLGRGCESCATCWMRDVCNISLTSRKWAKVARTALYVGSIYSPAFDAAESRKANNVFQV
jgi:hypothetical protein